MSFFIPGFEDSEQAEVVYQAIVEGNNAGPQKMRIYSIEFWHYNEDSGMDELFKAVVGERAPAYYKAIGPIMAILDSPMGYLICTRDRGGVVGEPILVTDMLSNIVFF